MAENKRYYWLKLNEDFFTSKRIKKLRKLAGGDTYTIIYLKMQLLSLQKGGVLEYTGLEDTFCKELALDLDEDEENIKVTIAYLSSCDLLTTSDNIEYSLPFVQNNLGSETASTQRSRKSRNNVQEVLQCNNDATACNNLQQKCNVEIDIDIEKDIEIDKEIDKEESTLSELKKNQRQEKIDYQRIVDSYNEICSSLPKCTKITESRKLSIRKRLEDYSEADLLKAFELAEQSDFLSGRNGKWTGANIDWILNVNNIQKILEGNYKNKVSETTGKSKINWDKV